MRGREGERERGRGRVGESLRESGREPEGEWERERERGREGGRERGRERKIFSQSSFAPLAVSGFCSSIVDVCDTRADSFCPPAFFRAFTSPTKVQIRSPLPPAAALASDRHQVAIVKKCLHSCGWPGWVLS